MPAPIVPIPSVSPSAAPAPDTVRDIWWSGYWQGFQIAFWLIAAFIVVALVAYYVGRNHFSIKRPSWWEHHDKKVLPDEKWPKLSGH